MPLRFQRFFRFFFRIRFPRLTRQSCVEICFSTRFSETSQDRHLAASTSCIIDTSHHIVDVFRTSCIGDAPNMTTSRVIDILDHTFCPINCRMRRLVSARKIVR